MTNLTSSKELLAKLNEAAKRKMTAEEMRRQKISFIMSSAGDNIGITKQRIEEVLARQECR